MSDQNKAYYEELPLTHLERMDQMQFEANQKKELELITAERDKYVARQNRKAARKEVAITAWCVTAAALVISVIVYAVAIDDDPVTPDDYKKSEAYREERCINSGGGWVSGELLISAEHGMCIYPGKSPEVPAQ